MVGWVDQAETMIGRGSRWTRRTLAIGQSETQADTDSVGLRDLLPRVRDFTSVADLDDVHRFPLGQWQLKGELTATGDADLTGSEAGSGKLDGAC